MPDLSPLRISARRLRPARLLGGCAALFAAALLGAATWSSGGEIAEMRALDALKQGGNVIYLRHADRARGPKEHLSQFSSDAEIADCQDQRNLTDRGRAHAREVGLYFREIGIKVGRVIANGQCRTRDTALIAFGHAEVDKRLFDVDYLRRLLAAPPAAGTNTVIVSNDFGLRQLTGIGLAFNEAAVVRPGPHGDIVVVARLDLDDLAEAAAPGWW
jgi:hypothetical protein